MSDTTEITRTTSLGPCPHCHRDLAAEAVYLVGAVQADALPPNVKPAAVPAGAVANLTLAGLRVNHECGKAARPQQHVSRGEGILPGGPRIGGSGGPGISINVVEPPAALDVAEEVRRLADADAHDATVGRG